MQQLMVVGDVHGCYHTFKGLVERYWDPETMMLIQVGDMVNKGLHSEQCLSYWKDLSKKFPERTIYLVGNHELKFVEHLEAGGLFSSWGSIHYNLKKEGLKPQKVAKWLKKLPLKWENDHLLISHAGVGKKVKKPFKRKNSDGVVFNKGPLKDVGKLQVKGHSIVNGDKPVFKPSENAWYIDTGAWTKRFLSALIINEDATKPQIVRVPTSPADRTPRWGH